MIQKTAQAVGDLIGYKFADKITKVSKISPQNTTEAVPSETKVIFKYQKKDIYPQKRGSKLLNIQD